MEIISLALVTLLSTFLFYLYLLSVAVSWIQGKRLREEFALNVPSLFVTMIGSGIMLLIFNLIFLGLLLLISANIEFIGVATYNIVILIIQTIAGFVHYKQYERREGPVGRSIVHQFLMPNWKPEFEINYITTVGPYTNREGKEDV